MMPAARLPLILLPGLGADRRQFDPQRSAWPGLQVPAWIPHQPDESLADYAGRLAERIDPPADYFLGGASFGGMIAQELAARLDPPPRAVFLIASARRGEQVAPHLHYFARFAPMFPQRRFDEGGVTPLYVAKFGALSDEQRGLLEAMVRDTLPEFVRWGIAALTQWPGVDPPPRPIRHIHGTDDQLIPRELVEPDETIPGGGHLLNVTHAQAVNDFLQREMDAILRGLDA
jgi:pimeloyl-ACP methyl ester carboxylesterase